MLCVSCIVWLASKACGMRNSLHAMQVATMQFNGSVKCVAQMLLARLSKPQLLPACTVP